MTARQTVLVVGVSGVGKTTACRKFVGKHPEFIYVSASAILAEATGLSSEQLRSTSEQDVVSRQKEIEDYVIRMKADLPLKSFIIDGHVIVDNGEKLIDLPIETAQAIAPDRIVHLSLDPVLLIARRHSDDRSRPSRSAEELRQYQALSEKRALYFSHILKIPNHLVSGDANLSLSSFD